MISNDKDIKNRKEIERKGGVGRVERKEKPSDQNGKRMKRRDQNRRRERYQKRRREKASKRE